MLEVGTASTTPAVVEPMDKSVGATPEIRTNNKKTFLENLPRRTISSSLLKVVSNVRPEPHAGGFQIDGSSGSDNTFFIDGQEITIFKSG